MVLPFLIDDGSKRVRSLRQCAVTLPGMKLR
jgi:hypothetical protein